MKINSKLLFFVVEDDKGLNALTTSFLKSLGCKNVKSFYDGESAVANLHLNPDVFIQDFDLGKMNGLDVMIEAKKVLPNVEFIFLSGQESINVAIETLNKGAFDYVVKDNFVKENLSFKLRKLLKIKTLEKERKTARLGWVAFMILFVLSMSGAYLLHKFG